MIVSPWVGKGVVESTQLQDTSILVTVREIFGISKPVTKRDAAAGSFANLFSQATPRTDAPLTLPRAALPQSTAAADDARHPLNQSLDDTQREILLGVHHLTLASDTTGPPADELPITQGEAAKFIRARYEKQFGPCRKWELTCVRSPPRVARERARPARVEGRSAGRQREVRLDQVPM